MDVSLVSATALLSPGSIKTGYPSKISGSASALTQIAAAFRANRWVVESSAAQGIRCEQSAEPKSDLYVDLLPLLNSRRIELLDHPRLVTQLCGLERRTARGGRDSIDHAPGGQDNLANAVAGAAASVTKASW